MKSLLILLVVLSCLHFLQGYEFQPEEPAKYWNFNQLKKVPVYREAGFPESRVSGLRDVLYQGLGPNGSKAEVFAYIGYPQGKRPEGGWPGIVLVHGGGGTAYPDEVRRWNGYGYAVIAIDWYNRRPLGSSPDKQRFNLPGGPFKAEPNTFVPANIVLAHSLLLSLPDVDRDKTGFIGLSWGSWFGAMVAAIDPRFCFAIEIYCGDLCPKSPAITNGRFLHAAKVPMYWIVGTNDQNATPLGLQQAFDACGNLWNKSMVVNLPHGHIGFQFNACRRVADAFLRNGTPLPRLGKPVIQDGVCSAPIIEQGKGLAKAVFCYTCDGNPAEDMRPNRTSLRKWQTIPAVVKNGCVSIEIPKGTYQCFFSIYDEESPWNDCCGSSDLICNPCTK